MAFAVMVIYHVCKKDYCLCFCMPVCLSQLNFPTTFGRKKNWQRGDLTKQKGKVREVFAICKRISVYEKEHEFRGQTTLGWNRGCHSQAV